MNDLFLHLYVRSLAFVEREEGQDLVEYALLCALVALSLVASMKSMGTALSTQFSKIAASV
jgi:Flp pilus assembly pilin Flp